jgi:hypothetical protein
MVVVVERTNEGGEDLSGSIGEGKRNEGAVQPE